MRDITPELSIAGVMLAIMYSLSLAFGLPIVYPSGGGAAFVGVHYIYPLIGIAVLGVVTFAFGNRTTALRFMVALPSYAVVLFAHFNIKLWIPHINPRLYDSAYWSADELLRPVVDGCKFARVYLFYFIPFASNAYILLFIAVFYVSIVYHALKTPEIFGKLTVAVLLLQALGTLGYLVAPAIGPFIFETGVDPIATSGQRMMLEFYNLSVSRGPDFLLAYGGHNFMGGAAAMPSLHVASAFLFFMFAWKYGKALVLPYSLILVFIIISSVANRWHYVVDLPVGIFVAWISFALADRFVPLSATWSAAE